MERFLEQREKIGRKLNRLMKKLEKAMLNEAASVSASSPSPQPDKKESGEAGSLLLTTTASTSTNSDINNTTKSSSSGCFDGSSSAGGNSCSNGGGSSGTAASVSRADELREQIDIMKSNIDYLQDQIAECQTNIIQLDEAKDGCDYMTLESLVHTISSVDEAKFMLKKFLVLSLNKGIVAAQKEHLSGELECELEQVEKDYYLQQQVVQQIISSGQISNEVVQQILLYNQPVRHVPGSGSGPVPASDDSQQPRAIFDTPFQANASFMMMNGVNDNFEIDEIILAPMIDGNITLFIYY